MKHVVVRTHGGLGNQIFQILYARLYSSRASAILSEVHDPRYAHGFGRNSEIACAPAPSAPSRAVSALRLPKVSTRLRRRCDAITLFGTTYLDGYFQQMVDYAGFDDASLRRELIRLREELQIPDRPTHAHGMHLRLGDFFTSDAAVTAHLNERLAQIGPDTGIITNEEARLRTPSAAAALSANRAWVVPTADMTAEQVLRTLASFQQVDGNDSTLLFWASVLSGMQCAYRNLELRALRQRFLDALKG